MRSAYDINHNLENVGQYDNKRCMNFGSRIFNLQVFIPLLHFGSSGSFFGKQLIITFCTARSFIIADWIPPLADGCVYSMLLDVTDDRNEYKYHHNEYHNANHISTTTPHILIL